MIYKFSDAFTKFIFIVDTGCEEAQHENQEIRVTKLDPETGEETKTNENPRIFFKSSRYTLEE